MEEQKNNLAYMLAGELIKTADKFARKCPKSDHSVALGAGNTYIASILVGAPTKADALKTLDDCVALMRNAINQTPDSFFGSGVARIKANFGQTFKS